MPPEFWQQTTLSKYATIIMGQSPSSEYFTADPNDVPLLQGNRTFRDKYPYYDTFTKKVTKLAQTGNVIVSVRAPVGDINMAPTRLCLGRGVAALSSKDSNNEYLYYLLKSLVPVLNQNENGSTFGSINKTDLEQLPIYLPPLEDRSTIGHILSSLDKKIQLSQSINDNLEAQISALFSRVVESSNGDSIRFGNLIKIGSGGTPKTSISEYWNGEIPFFSPKDIDGIYTYYTEKYITKLGLDNCNSDYYPKNTTIITARGTVGKITLTARDMAMNQSCYAIIARNKGQEYYIHQLSLYAADSIKQKSNGAVFDTINAKDITEESVPNLTKFR